jgi:hypothetical protein
MDQQPLEQDRRYLLKHTSQTVPAVIASLDYRANIGTLAHEPAEALAMNDIGVAVLRLMRPIALDRYAENRTTGAFILIDPETNGTVAAGMVTEVQADDTTEEAISSSSKPVTAEERSSRWGHTGGVLELHGPAELLNQIERSLFVSNAVTIRCSAVEHANLAAQAGILALLAVPSNEESLTVRVAGAEVKVDADNPDQAVAAVYRLLATSGILADPKKSGSQ